MSWSAVFITGSILLGVGLAMDAFSVSLANGLNEPKMSVKKICGIAGMFAFFQALMPMIGWFCVHNLVCYFKVFEKFIPWIALVLLLFIGGKMLIEGLHPGEDEDGFGGLGVYMTRVKKAFAFDKMFAVIFLISAISLALMALVEHTAKKCMPYLNQTK